MPTAKQVINSIKPNLTKAPQGQTQKGSAGYDNIRDDIEKTKSLREGTIEHTPTLQKHIVNKEYVDGQNLWEDNAGTTNIQLKTADNINIQDRFLYLDTAKTVGLVGIGGNLGVGLAAGKTLDMQTKKIINVVDPTANQEAATKKYVDDNIGVGDVTAGANLTDETLVQGDGGAKGIKTTLVTAAQVTANTAKNTNVTTNLSLGTKAPTTMDVNSSDGTNATLIEADTTNAGLLGSDKWDEIVANTSAKHTQGTDTALGAQAENLDMNTHKIVGVVDPTANQEAATKKYVDDNGGGDTNIREMFLYPMDAEWSAELGGHGIALLSSTGETHFAFRVPPDYTSIDSIGVICIPDTTETVQWDVTISKTALGGDHADTITLNDTQAVTLNTAVSLDIKDTYDLADPSVGDFIGVFFKSDTTSIKALGLLVAYS